MVVMIQLSNEYLTVVINEFGAEIQSIRDRSTNYEFIWQADPDYWKRHAPVLFPIIGRLKDQQYQYNGKVYTLGAHGFARDSRFEVVEQTETSATFELTNVGILAEIYPFTFRLVIQISLEHRQVLVQHFVTNTSTSMPLYYSVGGHPAFNVLQDANDEFQEVRVFIEQQGALEYVPLTDDGFVKISECIEVASVNQILKHQDFINDALIYHLKEPVRIVLEDARIQIEMMTQEMPYLGIWSPYPVKAPFVCLEPWAGLPDDWQHTGDFTKKAAIYSLEPEHTQMHAYQLNLAVK